MLLAKYATRYFASAERVLEIGPDLPSVVQRAVGGDRLVWHTLDLSTDPAPNGADSWESLRTYITRDEYSFPVPDDAYDVVIAANVLEHVRKIWVWIKEVARVVRPGGYVITVNPVSWPYHEVPFDCWRVYPEGMKALYDEAGLEVVFSTWESLEAPGRPRRIPGRSQEAVHGLLYGFQDPHAEGWKTRYMTKVLEAIGYPVERAYDTITIGRKPAESR
jgi:SAM-dependent methyltransferase